MSLNASTSNCSALSTTRSDEVANILWRIYWFKPEDYGRRYCLGRAICKTWWSYRIEWVVGALSVCEHYPTPIIDHSQYNCKNNTLTDSSGTPACTHVLSMQTGSTRLDRDRKCMDSISHQSLIQATRWRTRLRSPAISFPPSLRSNDRILQCGFLLVIALAPDQPTRAEYQR